ncbi:MAG TPA: hypothetical protein VK034_22860 [Enhygromyxa sp.]|nr:hypothetical protein [Enhygromyxa sp.]
MTTPGLSARVLGDCRVFLGTDRKVSDRWSDEQRDLKIKNGDSESGSVVVARGLISDRWSDEQRDLKIKMETLSPVRGSSLRSLVG